jgi:hypothetical protein
MFNLRPPSYAFLFHGDIVYRCYTATVELLQTLPGGMLGVVQTSEGLAGIVPMRWLVERTSIR